MRLKIDSLITAAYCSATSDDSGSYFTQDFLNRSGIFGLIAYVVNGLWHLRSKLAPLTETLSAE